MVLNAYPSPYFQARDRTVFYNQMSERAALEPAQERLERTRSVHGVVLEAVKEPTRNFLANLDAVYERRYGDPKVRTSLRHG